METTSFEYNLRQQLESDPVGIRQGKRILAILNARPSKRRTRRIAAMESNVKEQLENKGLWPAFAEYGSSIDWSTIDWSVVFMFVLKILLALIPFLLIL